MIDGINILRRITFCQIILLIIRDFVKRRKRNYPVEQKAITKINCNKVAFSSVAARCRRLTIEFNNED